MLHHVSKEGSQRGTSAREDNLDISILLKMPNDYTPEDGCRFICHFSKARIATKDLPLISDTEFKLVEQDSGHLTWEWKNVKKERKKEILKMLDDGLDYETITKNLGITKGYISRIRKDALSQGLITPEGKLTGPGSLYVSSD
jgi:hypothetical protein